MQYCFIRVDALDPTTTEITANKAVEETIEDLTEVEAASGADIRRYLQEASWGLVQMMLPLPLLQVITFTL